MDEDCEVDVEEEIDTDKHIEDLKAEKTGDLQNNEQLHDAWLLQSMNAESIEDVKTKQLVQEMIKEERKQLLGNNTSKSRSCSFTVKPKNYLSRSPVKKETGSKRSTVVKRKTSNTSNAISTLPDWSGSEKSLLLSGLKVFGRNWSEVARLVGTKSETEVRDFTSRSKEAQDLLRQNKKLEAVRTANVSVPSTYTNEETRIDLDDAPCSSNIIAELISSPEVVRVRKEDTSTEADVEVDDVSDTPSDTVRVQAETPGSSGVSVRVTESSLGRKRKAPQTYNDWLHLQSGKEGVTTEHGPDGEAVAIYRGRMKHDTQPKRCHDGKNPFTLYNCNVFSDPHEAPCAVVISSAVFVQLFSEALSSQAEIMGLLGGDIHPTESDHLTVCITQASLCTAASTHLQCEMDPVSQLLTAQSIQRDGLRVVGWYHSHPAFPAKPSLRDIDTQTDLQNGPAPFVGVIISTERPNGDLKCFVVTETDASKAPYEVDVTTSMTSENDISKIKDILTSGLRYKTCFHQLMKHQMKQNLQTDKATMDALFDALSPPAASKDPIFTSALEIL